MHNAMFLHALFTTYWYKCVCVVCVWCVCVCVSYHLLSSNREDKEQGQQAKSRLGHKHGVVRPAERTRAQLFRQNASNEGQLQLFY